MNSERAFQVLSRERAKVLLGKHRLQRAAGWLCCCGVGVILHEQRGHGTGITFYNLKIRNVINPFSTAQDKSGSPIAKAGAEKEKREVLGIFCQLLQR